MNRKPFLRIFSGWITILILLAVHPLTKIQIQHKSTIDQRLAGLIRNTSVQLRLFAPKHGPQPVPGEQTYILAESLGTLATWQGITVIVTHNHWGSVLHGAEFATILDARGDILSELSGADFRALILHQDAGTMILAAPACQEEGCYPVLAELGDGAEVRAGDLVVFVHQASGQSFRLALHQARIASLACYKSMAVFKLHRLDGQMIIAGDSGGGIWFEGRLVGNIWGRFTEQRGEASYAAWIPQSSPPGVESSAWTSTGSWTRPPTGPRPNPAWSPSGYTGGFTLRPKSD